ncbi:hypothetical protein WJX73_005760 [Symbiochloris irregularis]|uniref:Dynein axonemal assembly factor 5 TPR repeats domain-containing protein n=1 Tax=Symbiochloris irregularis TaxID=706552 RepID=A0AAW1NPA6_9CHLO
MSSVDAVWSQLQKQRPSGISIADFRDVPGIKRSVRDIKECTEAQGPVPSSSAAHSLATDVHIAVGSGAGSLQRDVNCLKDPDRRARGAAAQALLKKVFGSGAYSPDEIQALFTDSLALPLSAMLPDPSEKYAFPDIKKAGCQAVLGLAKRAEDAFPAEPLGALISSLVANTTHQHSRTRLASLTAIQALVQPGAPESLITATVVPAMNQLAVDAAVNVRSACFEAIHAWLSQQRLKAWYCGLLPVLLLSVTDESPSIAGQSQQYLADTAAAYPGTPAVASLAGKALCDHLVHLLPSLRRSRGDDAGEVRAYAARALRSVGAAVPMRQWLPLSLEPLQGPPAPPPDSCVALAALTDLLAGAGAAEATMQEDMLQAVAATVAGVDLRENADAALQQHLLELLQTVISTAGCPTAQAGAQLWTTLLQQQAWVHSPAVQAPAQPSASQAAQQAQGLQQLHGPASRAMTALAHACGLPDAAELAARHAPELMSSLMQGHTTWDESSVAPALFVQLLHSCNVTTLRALSPSILDILETSIVPHHRPAGLRLLLLKGLESVATAPAQPPALATLSTGLAEPLTGRVLVPCLVWRAGLAAATIRVSCIGLVECCLRLRWLPAPALQGLVQGSNLLPAILQSLEDDYFEETRVLACQALQAMLLQHKKGLLALTDEERKNMQTNLLRRLDDADNTHR